MIINKVQTMQELKNKLLIDGSIPEEIRVAIIDETNSLIEYNTFSQAKQVLGNIYLGFVEKVEPSINVAFINFGEEYNGFLSFGDIHPDYYRKTLYRKKKPKIEDLIKKGQPVIVQVTREPSNTKSATLTTYIALAGKNCIFFPKDGNNCGISKKIIGDHRKRLKEFLATLEPNASLIIRTASHSASINEIKADYNKLKKLWETIVLQTKNKHVPMLLLQEDPLLKKLRSYSRHSVSSVEIQDKSLYEKINGLVTKNLIHFPSIKLGKNVFAKIEQQIQKLYCKQVSLPSGGSIIIEHTEALTAIDINSKNSLKEKTIEETAFKTNIEAAIEIPRQILLRNIGGLIVIDFIDMENEENIKAINKTVKTAFKDDKAAVTIIGISQLGLMQISRQRLNTSIINKHYETCETCFGSGINMKIETIALNLLRQIKQNNTKRKIYTTNKVMQFILNKYISVLANHKNLEWEIVDESNGMCNKIETIK